MKHKISFQQYRAIDLTIFTVLLALSQFVIFFAASTLFPDQPYVLSPVGALVALVMMRWGGYAAIPAVVSGILYTYLAKGGAQQYIIYSVGNLFSMLTLFMIKALGKERIRKGTLLSLLFALCVQVLMQLGRALIALCFGYSLGTCLGFITTDVLSWLFTLVVIWIARRVDGLFEDQKNYLLRLDSERQSEGRE